jgi:hypothetical protein
VRGPVVAIAAGLAVAAALIVAPRVTLFEDVARDACEERGADYAGLANGAGRYADPVPEGARCERADHGVDEVSVRFFADNGFLNGLIGWIYRLACLLVPLAAGFFLWGRGLGSAPM